MAATVLIVDDERDIRELIGEILADEDYRPILAANAEEARRMRAESNPDLVLLDVWMPDSDGISLLREWSEQDQPLCPVVMISGHGSVEAAVEATRYGARDFIEKPVSMARLLNTVRKALTDAQPHRERIERASAEIEALEPIGRSDAISSIRKRVDAIAGSNGHVLISGEPGTGRSTLARWVHARAAGPDAQWTEVRCGLGIRALESTRSEFENAPDRPMTLVIEPFESIDEADREALNAMLSEADSGLRVIAIATPGLEAQAANGRFETSLFHRVAQNRLDLPALRDRRDDIPELVRHLAEHLPAREGLKYRPVPVPVQNLLRQHDWPGNLRELVNTIRQLLAEGVETPVDPAEVTAALERIEPDLARSVPAAHSPLFELPLREAREEFERQYLIARLRRAEGSVGQLAESVEMERTHLYRKLRQLGIDPKQVQEDPQ